MYVTTEIQNPDASEGLKLSVRLMKNTPDDVLKKQIFENCRAYPDWLQVKPEHDKPAILLGGGDSINDHIHDIKNLQAMGGVVFATNKASKWAFEHGIKVDYQVIIDGQEETKEHVDLRAENHLFASRCHPETFKASPSPTLFHMLEWHDMEDLFPQERVEEGGYVLVGGDTSCGICAMCVAFTQGYRWLHIFGYDSSYRNGKSHGYEQKMNENMPTMEIEQCGQRFITSVGMFKQPASFMAFSKLLKDEGCSFNVYGEGLLQAIYQATAGMTEKEKYELMWSMEQYRTMSPGELLVDFFVENFKPEGKVIDFGCGTGRAGKRMKEKGLEPLLMDFTENSRDEDNDLPFVLQDLTEPINEKAEYGFCTDVMEHLPFQDVEKVIQNIMNSAEKVFFQISTTDDSCGILIGQRLHLTVEPHSWWKKLFINNGYQILWEQENDVASLFYIGGQPCQQ